MVDSGYFLRGLSPLAVSMLAEQPIIDEILKFFSDKLEVKVNAKGFVYAAYTADWLDESD